MQRERRLRLNEDFSRVHKSGKSFPGPLLIVRVHPNELPQPRIGFVVGKRVGGAVQRNLVKRRLREIARQSPILGGRDIVVIARAGAAEAPFDDLRIAMINGLKRAKSYGGEPADRPSANFPVR